MAIAGDFSVPYALLDKLRQLNVKVTLNVSGIDPKSIDPRTEEFQRTVLIALLRQRKQDGCWKHKDGLLFAQRCLVKL